VLLREFFIKNLMENFFKFIKKGIRSIVRETYLLMEDKPQDATTSDISGLEEFKTRLSELEQKVKSLENLPQTVANLQSKVDKLPTVTGNPKQQQSAVQKPQQTVPQTVSQSAKPTVPTSETHYVKRMGTSGDIEIRNPIAKNEALFELTARGNTAELHPLPEQSAYLIMQQKCLLEPAFVVSSTGQRVNCTTPAKYELQGSVWGVTGKGKVNCV
jgi:hypothetical protein